MRNSLYDALEVTPSASSNAIQTELRGVIRRFWSVPRDASGDSEEAVRFAALAASILVDPIRRRDYDAALNPGVGAGPWRLPVFGAVGRADAARDSVGTQSGVGAEGGGGLSQLSVEATPMQSLPGVDALADPLPDGSAWSSPLAWLALVLGAVSLVVVSAISLPAIVTVTVPFATGIGLVAVAVMLLIAFVRCRPSEAVGPAAGLSRLGIIKWRREGSVFIGVPPPQHDTAWIFKLRLMELTRSAAGFITATNVGRRLLARLADYALVATILYTLIALSDKAIDIADPWLIVIRSPLALPFLTVLLTVPLEVLFLRTMRTTPGKWLLGIVVVTGISRPADHSKPTTARLAWIRASRAAWTGAALGIWPITLFRLAHQWRSARDTEVEWDARGDSVVMARPLALPTVATALIVLMSATLLLTSGWRRDYVAFWPYALSWAASDNSGLSQLILPKRANPDPSEAPAPAPGTVDNVPEPVTAAVQAAPPARQPSLPLPVARGAGAPMAKNGSPPANAVATSAQISAADEQMNKQAMAAQARRTRIDGYASQAESALRSGSYAGLQGSCRNWTVDQPGSAAAWRCLGLAQFQNGAGSDALPALRQSLKLGSKDPQVEEAILRILRP